MVTFCDLDVGENQMTFGPNNNIGIESIKANDRSKMLQEINDRIIDGTYNTTDGLVSMIKSYANRYSELGRHRFAIKLNKVN